MNRRQIIGRLGADAASGKTQKGQEYSSFSVAATSGYGENKQTEWIDCLLIGQANVYQYLKKGIQVYCDGDSSTVEFKGKLQSKIMVRNLELLSKEA